MSYVLKIQIHDESLLPYYEKAVQKCWDNVDDDYADCGFDLFINDDFNTMSFDKNGMGPLKIDHKVSCAMFKTFFCPETGKTVTKPCAYYMYPRSSISKTPFRLANSVGIIDAGYRGNLIAKIDKVYDNDYSVTKGDRLFQICAPDLSVLKNVEIVQRLDETVRGSGGFGSTGK